MNQDEEHLRLLGIFHYIMSGITAFFSLLPGLYIVFGVAMLFAPQIFDNPHGRSSPPPPEFIGWFMIIFGAVFMIVGLTLATLMFMAGRSLGRRRHHLFCVVVAGLECVFMPFGTVLGIFTIIVLQRASAKQLFSAPPQ